MKQFSAHTLARFATIFMPIGICFGRVPAEILLGIVNLAFILHLFKEPDTSFFRARWVQLALLFWFFMMCRSLFAEQSSMAFVTSFTWGRFLLGAIAIAYWIQWCPATIKLTSATLTLSLSFLVLTSLWQYFTGYDLLGHPIWDNGRLTGPYRRPRIGATLSWISLPIILAALSPHLSPRMKNLGLFLSALIVAVIFLSGERAAWILFTATLLISGLVSTRYRKTTLFILIGCSAAGALALSIAPSFFERQIFSAFELITHLPDTLYGHIIKGSWQIWLDQPLFGVGANHFRYLMETPLDPLHDTAIHPHNFYLQLLAEQGLIGAALGISCFILLLSSLWKHRPDRLSDHYYYLEWGLLTTCMMRLWPLTFTMSFFNSVTMIPLWWMIGWALGMQQRRQHGSIQSQG